MILLSAAASFSISSLFFAVFDYSIVLSDAYPIAKDSATFMQRSVHATTFSRMSASDSCEADKNGNSPTSLKDLNWQPMRELRETTNIAALYRSDPTPDSPRLAKNEAYAKTVIDSWNDQLKSSTIETLGAPFIYTRDDGKPLGGYIVIPSTLIGEGKANVEANKIEKFPAIILFHTGAGPQDIFLRWRADLLAREVMGGAGCIVLIADLLSDLEGWTWCDRERYNKERTDILQNGAQEGNEGSTGRWKLRGVINSTLNAVRNIEQVDASRIAALGWCFGGQPILELGRMNCPGVLGVVSYHGVFDGLEKTSLTTETHNSDLNEKDICREAKSTEVNQRQCHPRALICNGNSDPYVKPEDLKAVLKIFERSLFALQVLSFDGAFHGFTNPYQDINPDENFAYSKEGAQKSWDSTIKLLHDVFTM